ncbi:MAG TPA: family 43 glycosylhydrolase, partial [Draconibacterium sp.]|nr:family 43 glycosylhydrolase [Draconibacterium sp.]
MSFISKTNYLLLAVIFIFSGCSKKPKQVQKSGNPVFEGWYADPEGMVFGDEFWIYPTYSDDFEKQVFFDAFSSKDLIIWEKHTRILDTTIIIWAKQAMWAPSLVEKNGKYYFFFGANDIQRKGSVYFDENNPI